MAATDRPLRADARRNREAILDAARAIFAEQGLDVPLDTIAEAAGVGRATRQRHFPTRASLIQAVFDEYLDQLGDMFEQVEDPTHAFEELLYIGLDGMLEDRSLLDMANSRYVVPEVQQHIAARVLEQIAEPLRLAQEAGRVRADLRPDDFFLLMDMLGAVARVPVPDVAIDRIDRGVTLIMEAIAPNPRRPLDPASGDMRQEPARQMDL
jgi:AcrR family transcriptional regulator